ASSRSVHALPHNAAAAARARQERTGLGRRDRAADRGQPRDAGGVRERDPREVSGVCGDPRYAPTPVAAAGTPSGQLGGAVRFFLAILAAAAFEAYGCNLSTRTVT